MPDLHELLAREASRGGPVSTPPFETLVARSRQRRVKQALAIASVAVAVTAAVVVPLLVGGRGSVVVAGQAVTTTDAARKAAAQQVANQLVAEVRLPTGASPQVSAPTFPTFQAPTKDTVIAVRYFSAPVAVDAVIAYVLAHPPGGLVANGTTESSSTGSSGTLKSRGVDFIGIATSSYGAPSLSVDVVPQGAGVGVSVFAQVLVRPLRTTAEQVPSDIAAVTVVARQSGGAVHTYTWDSSRARVLAAALNAFDAELSSSTDVNCPLGDPTFTVTFEVAHQPLVFKDDGCGGTAVTAGGVAQPALEGTLDSRLYGMLGLEAPPQSSGPPAGTPPPPGASSPAP